MADTNGKTQTRFEHPYGYDALNPAGKRKRTGNQVYREDHYTRYPRHTGLQASAADLARNMSLAAWMVRRHLDYVSMFEFKSRTENKPIDDAIERLMLEDSRKNAFDIAAKFNREKMFRLAEMRRVFDGDTLLVKLNDGRMQGVQADLLRNPADLETSESEDWVNGVRVNRYGRALQFGIYQRKGYTGTEYVRRLPATNVIHYGFFERYAQDQVRGVSPLVAALNPLRDVYENFNYALMKAKVSQLFALAFYRDAEDAPLAVDDDPSQGVEDEDGDHKGEPRGFQAFVKSDTRYVDMDPGEKVEMIESKTPSSEFQNFTELVIQVALKSLDIPYSFYDESHTNFFGSRAAWLHYERSAKDKRDDQREMRRQYTVWKYRRWIQNGRLTLPANMRIDDLPFEWIPRGMPWWDPSKEIRGFVDAINAGLDTPQRICKMTGTDYFENIDEIAKATEYAEASGVNVTWNESVEQPAAADGDVDSDVTGLDEAKQLTDAYGVAVRAGAITPQQEDETFFREFIGVPSSTPPVDEAWDEDDGYRRPITLLQDTDEPPANPMDESDSTNEGEIDDSNSDNEPTGQEESTNGFPA